MKLSLVLVLLTVPALAAPRPVGRAARGSLDEQVVTQDAAGVLVQFKGLSRADAQTRLDAAAKSLLLSGGLQVGFFKTPQATLAAIYVVAPGALTVKRLKELATECSRLEGAVSATVFLHPGPRNEELETEAYWRYAGGQLTKEKRLAFRDDEAWVDWVRRKIETPQLEQKKWPAWPLSELAIALGVPGRIFFEQPMSLLDLATWPAPTDVGDNLVLVTVHLPDATVLEMRQRAERTQASISKVVQDALVAADGAKKLGAQVPTSGRAPWDEAMPQAEKAPPRQLVLYLTQEVFSRLEAHADDEALSLSRLIEYAWRNEHPWVETRKKHR